MDLKPDCGSEAYVELEHTESRVSELSIFLEQLLQAGYGSRDSAVLCSRGLLCVGVSAPYAHQNLHLLSPQRPQDCDCCCQLFIKTFATPST